MVSLLTTLMVAGALTSDDSDLLAVTTTSSPGSVILSVVDGTSTAPVPLTSTVWVSVLNPRRVAVTLWLPAGTPVNVYRPSLPLTANLLAPGPMSWTFAPGSDAPDSSTSDPETVAPPDCAHAGTVTASAIDSATNSRQPFMRPP